jgi:hypothetical protein
MWELVKDIVPKQYWNGVKLSVIRKRTRMCKHYQNGKIKSWEKTMGFYVREKRVIEIPINNYTNGAICEKYGDNILFFNMIHELAHYVWYERLDVKCIEQYIKISPKHNTVTNYAKIAVSEDFAESFAWYYYFCFNKELHIDDKMKDYSKELDLKRYHFFKILKVKGKNDMGLWEYIKHVYYLR